MRYAKGDSLKIKLVMNTHPAHIVNVNFPTRIINIMPKERNDK